MSIDRRIDAARVVIDDVLFRRTPGRHVHSCAICEGVIAPGEERYVPARFHEREMKRLVHGRDTRLCVPCVAERLGEAGVRRGAA